MQFPNPLTWRSRALRTLLGAGLALATIGAVTPKAQALNLRERIQQKGDFRLIGNTFGQDGAAGIPLPLSGVLGLLGINLNDTGIDAWWRSDSPSSGLAEVSSSILPSQARTTSILTLPEGSTVTHAYLYWAAQATPSGTQQVTFERAGTFSQTVTALTTTTATLGSTCYNSVADVTALVQANGPGAYRVSGATLPSILNLNSSTAFAGWSLLVIYSNPSEPLRSISVFDGLDLVIDGQPSNFSATGFTVPENGTGKIGILGFEGDSTTGDQLSIGGTPLTNNLNPADNLFNSTRSLLGLTDTLDGDLPKLSGDALSLGGLDIDVLNITSNLSTGLTDLAGTITTTTDSLLLGLIATAVDMALPNFDVAQTACTITDLNGGSVVAGDILEITCTAQNGGGEGSANSVLTATIPTGGTYVSNSMVIDGISKLDNDANDAVDVNGAAGTIVARLGSGATNLLGGSIGIGSSSTLKFRVTVNNNATSISTTSELAFGSLSLPNLGELISRITSLVVSPTVGTVAPNSTGVSGGLAITIEGTGFVGVTGVTVGGVPASNFTVNSATNITAVAPPHAEGTVDVTVTTLVGTANGVSKVTYLPDAKNDAVTQGTGPSVLYPLANDPLADTTVASVSEPTVTIAQNGRALVVPHGFTGSFTYTTADGRIATVNVNAGTPQAAPRAYAGLLFDTAGAMAGWSKVKVSATGVCTIELRFGQVVSRGKLKLSTGTALIGKRTVTAAVNADGTINLGISAADANLTGKLRSLLSTSAAEKHHVALESLDSAIPGGGILIAKVNLRGAARITGTLPDGRPIAVSTGMSDNGSLAFHTKISSKVRGQLTGELIKANLPTTDTTGELTWIKPAQGPDAKGLHLTGVDTILLAKGSLYNGTIPLAGTGTLNLTGGDLAPETQTITITAGIPAFPTGSLFKWTGAKPKAGTFTPFIKLTPTSRPAKGKGLYLPKSNTAWGFFPGMTVGGRIQLTQ